MDVEGVCRRLFGPRRRASSDIRSYMTERILLDRLADRDRVRERERERLHVRGEAHPLLNLKQQQSQQPDDEDSSMIDPLLLQQPCAIVR